MEISNFIWVWISVIISLSYCYFSAKIIPKGLPRLFSTIPTFSLFFALPLLKLHFALFSGITGFCIAWLANFNLLLLAFGKGPLSDPSLSLPCFLVIACFPISISQKPLSTSHANPQTSQNNQNTPPKGQNRDPRIARNNGKISIWNYGINVAFLALFLPVYGYRNHIHPKVMLAGFCFHASVLLETVLASAAAAIQALFGLELEPHFDKPYLSSSVQNFWGKRWNLVASRSLRLTVYEPALCVSAKLIGRKWASLPAVMCTFVVSALMHEIIIYYMGRQQPTWEITWFFLLQGACVVVEIWVKKVVKDRWRLPRLISTPMTLGFVMITALWLFIPHLFGACLKDINVVIDLI